MFHTTISDLMIRSLGRYFHGDLLVDIHGKTAIIKYGTFYFSAPDAILWKGRYPIWVRL